MRTVSQWLIERGIGIDGSIEYLSTFDGGWTAEARSADMFPDRETAEAWIAEHGIEGTAVEHGFMSEVRRVRIPLSDGHMDVSIDAELSDESLAAFKEIGEAAIRRMREEQP